MILLMTRMRYFIYFWVVFALYFIIAHPAIIYYNTHPPYYLEGKSPVMALIYLVIAVLGWGAVFAVGFRLVYKYTLGLRKGLHHILTNGTRVTAEIVKIVKSKINSKGQHPMEIVVKFNNFSGQPIPYTITLVDTKPHLKRYEVGKQVSLRVDKSLKQAPYVTIEGAEAKLRPGMVVLGFGVWAILLALLITYFMYAYNTESQGYGWRFLDFSHPLILSLIILLVVVCIGYSVVYRSILSRISGVDGKRSLELLFFGDRATAFVSNTSQTGTYINEQPEVKYEMHYTDMKGVRHELSLKKVVNLLSLHSVQESTKKIFYLPDAPHVVAFEEDLIP